jgi:ankyrin repeat protein
MMHKRFFIALAIICYPVHSVYGMDTAVDVGHIDVDKTILHAVHNNRIDELKGMLCTNNFVTESALHAAKIALETYGKKSPIHQLLLDYILAYRAYRYDMDLFTELLQAGANINTTVNGNQPLIIYAALNQEKDALNYWFKYLVEHGADVNSVDTRNFSVLSIICMIQYIPTSYITLLLERGANPNVLIGQTNPEPLLHWTIKHNKENIFFALLRYGADIDILDEDGKTAFDICAEYKCSTFAERQFQAYAQALLFIKKMLPTNKNIDLSLGHDALDAFMSAIAAGQDLTELAPCLKNPHICSHLWFTHYNKAHPIEKLINAIPNSSLHHRLMIYSCIEILISPTQSHEAPINPFSRLSKNGCLLEQIIKINDEHLLKLCLQKEGVKFVINGLIDHTTQDHKADTTTFLHLCVQHNFPAGIKMICDVCDNKMIDTTDKDGNTPFAYALKLGHTDCAQVLLNHRCNPGDATTIDVAKTDCPEVVELLKNAQSITVYDLPSEVLKYIFTHTAQGNSLKKRMTSLVDSPMRVNKIWNTALKDQPQLLPDCAATYATLNANEINKMLYSLLTELSVRQDDNRLAALFHYLASLDINGIKSEQFSLLDRAIGDYNIEAVKTIIGWYEKYDNKAKLANPNHVPLINQPSCFTWNFSTCNFGIVTNNGMPALGYAFFMLKSAQKQCAHNTKRLFSALNCINYLLKHDANPDILIQVHGNAVLSLISPIPLPVVALLEHLEYTIPLLIKHGIDVNRLYSLDRYNPRTGLPGNPWDVTLLTLAANRNNKDAIEILLKIAGIEINKVVNGATALDVANQVLHSNEIITLLTNAGAKHAAHLAINNNAPAAPIQNHPVPPAGHLADANQHNALPNNNVAHIANNPDPVPGNNTQLQAVNWLGKKPMYWIAGIAACTVGIYAWYKYTHPEEIDEEDLDENIQQELQPHISDEL